MEWMKHKRVFIGLLLVFGTSEMVSLELFNKMFIKSGRDGKNGSKESRWIINDRWMDQGYWSFNHEHGDGI